VKCSQGARAPSAGDVLERGLRWVLCVSCAGVHVRCAPSAVVQPGVGLRARKRCSGRHWQGPSRSIPEPEDLRGWSQLGEGHGDTLTKPSAFTQVTSGCEHRGSSGFEVPHKHPSLARELCLCGRSLGPRHVLFRFVSGRHLWMAADHRAPDEHSSATAHPKVRA